jgi:hypothetical protein
MATEISDMVIDEISLVDDPANEQARVLIVKAKKKPSPAGEMPKAEESDEEYDDEESEDDLEKLKQAAHEIDKRVERTRSGGFPVDDAAGLAAASLKEYEMDIEALSKALEDAEAKLTTLTKRVDEAEAALADAHEVIKAKDAEIDTVRKSAGSNDDDAEEAFFKSLPAKVRKRLEDSEAIAKAAQAELTAMREKAETTEAIAKARAYKIGDANIVGPLMLRIAKGTTTQADVEALEGILKGAGEVAEKSDLFRAMGSDSAPEGDPESLLKAKAEEIRKANSGMSFEQAYEKALVMNPALYSAYISKRRAA